MKYFSNPLVWLIRIRKRCGYGVHSPYAFRFVTEVVYEQHPYYAYSELDTCLPLTHRFRVKKMLHLLFRVANRFQPDVMVVAADAPLAAAYLQAGCRRATLLNHFPEEKVDLCLLTSPNQEVLQHLHSGSVLILDHLNRHRRWFADLPAVVTFDLYDVGIAFFDNQYHKQHYITNF